MTAQQQAKDPRPTWVRPLVIFVILVIAAIYLANQGDDGGNGSGDDREPSTNITGSFTRWEPVDDARGYAYFTVTNRGSTAAEATCTVTVRNDFGNFGFDIMSGERIAAGATESYRMPIDVDEGSFLVDRGEVTDC